MNKIPQHLGIIMDGNRRWAKSRSLPAFQGHIAGVEALKKIVSYCSKKGIKILTVYAFSTENWQRSGKEVGFLMGLFQKVIDNDLKDLVREDVRLRFIGRKEMLPRGLAASLAKAEESTKGNQGMILNVALSYGGRAEIVSALKEIVGKKIPAEKITEATVAENLWAPDLEFVIRTGGEQRLSNFLIWQSAYAELYFSPKYWPDFTEKDLDDALEDFAKRQRRHGK